MNEGAMVQLITVKAQSKPSIIRKCGNVKTHIKSDEKRTSSESKWSRFGEVNEESMTGLKVQSDYVIIGSNHLSQPSIYWFSSAILTRARSRRAKQASWRS
ncbi:unnamed protein product [Hymenolepis diminuta]|uniref:Uncharacterized protein n=1 Tax=Hymenolepis diminuta TaxID=6216 RepID=A0A564YGW2_HYMDI|nr:unnamed protein product [Hymenolepis diminuta]